MKQDDFSTVNMDELTTSRQWQFQYRVLMNWGGLVHIKPELRVEQNKIRGCAANAWLALREGRFYFDSDSRIINGLAALLLAQIDAKKIAVGNLSDWQHILQDAGLQRHLSPSRNNGVQALIRRMGELWNDDTQGSRHS